MKASEEKRAENESKVEPNKSLIFEGAVTVDAVDRWGKDLLYLDLLFNEGIKIRMFDPHESVARRSRDAAVYGSLLAAFDDDFETVEGCFGWEDFCQKIVFRLSPHNGGHVYAKLTLNEEGWITFGEGRCMSKLPDMEYTQKDTRFLTAAEDAVGIGFDNLPG